MSDATPSDKPVEQPAMTPQEKMMQMLAPVAQQLQSLDKDAPGYNEAVLQIANNLKSHIMAGARNSNKMRQQAWVSAGMPDVLELPANPMSPKTYFISNPKDLIKFFKEIEDDLKDNENDNNPEVYTIGRGQKFVRSLLGQDALPLMDSGAKHRMVRKIQGNFFRQENIASMANRSMKPSIDMAVERIAELANSEQEFDLVPEVKGTTLRSIFGFTISDPNFPIEESELDAMPQAFSDLELWLVFSNLPLIGEYFKEPLKAIFDESINKALGFIYRMIDYTRENKKPGTPEDYVSLLVDLDNEGTFDSPVLNIEDKREFMKDQILSMYLAGHGTTAQGETATMYYLAKYPEVQERVYNEIYEAFGDGEINPEELHKKCPYLMNVIGESLRLMLPTVNQERVPSREFITEDGTVIPAVGTIKANLHGVHTSAQYYENPLDFNPERFEQEGNSMAILTREGKYMPFGAGPHMCIGRGFALVEIALATAEFVRNFKFNLREEFEPVVEAHGGLNQIKELPVRAASR